MSRTGFEGEIERIRKEYERRDLEIPEGYYSLDKPSNRFMHTQRLLAARGMLEQNQFFPLSKKKILEIGCGSGGWLPDFEKWGVDQSCLHGIDLDESRIAQARRRLPKAELIVREASGLPWPSRHFDIVLQSTVFSSILLPELKQTIADEMLRVLKPGGMILWYDFFWNNPWNPNVRGVKAREIKRLFSHCRVELERITLASPLLRTLAPRSASFCVFLERLKFLNTHYLACIIPPLIPENERA